MTDTPQDYVLDTTSDDIARIIAEKARRENASDYWRSMYGMEKEHIVYAARLGRSEMPNLYDLVRARWYAKTFAQEWLSELVDMTLAMSASVGGRAREEAVRAMTGAGEEKVRSLLRLRRAEKP